MDYEIKEWLSELRELTPNEYQQAESNAEKMVLRDIGKEPQRSDFKRDIENKFKDPIFFLLFVILIAAIFVTALEAFEQVGFYVSNINAFEYIYGIPVDKSFKSVVFQLGFVLLAETTMLASLINWRTEIVEKEKRNFYKGMTRLQTFYNKYVDIRPLVGLMSVVFIFWINWNSQLPMIMRFMIPFISVSLGYLFESYYSEFREENRRITKEYNSYHDEWNLIKREPQKHPDFQTMLMRSIWEKIRSKNDRYTNVDLDVSGNWKWLAVERELNNANWAKYGMQKQRLTHTSNYTQEEVESLTPLEVLRDLMETWEVGDNPVIEVGDYIVHMENLVFSNTREGWDKFSKSVGGLKKIVTTEKDKNK